jgi:hypothetical protein
VPSRPDHWNLSEFDEWIDRWIEQESPDVELRLAVRAWLLSRLEDPYQGVRREPGFENLWSCTVPGTRRGWTAVVCSYFIFELTGTIRCNSLATLSWPA